MGERKRSIALGDAWGTQDYKRMHSMYHMRAVGRWRRVGSTLVLRIMHEQAKQAVHGGRVLHRSLLFPFARKRLTPEETWESNQNLKRRGRGGLVGVLPGAEATPRPRVGGPFAFGRTWPRRDGRGEERRGDERRMRATACMSI